MDSLSEKVISFVSDFTGIPIDHINESSTLFGDLGVDGMDGDEILEEFARKFSVDMHHCRVDQHFGPELPPTLFSLIRGLFIQLFSRTTPEERAGLIPITVTDLVESARRGYWWFCHNQPSGGSETAKS